MNNAKHTPGPWTLARDRAKSLSLYSGSVFIGEVYHEVDEPSTQEQANAHLIAAAPAMYEALQMVSTILYDIADSAEDVAEWNEGGQMYELSRAVKTALAQAEGRG